MFGDVHEGAVSHIFWSVKAVMPIAEISNEFIRHYFNLGLNYDEIIASLLANNNIIISKRHLNRKL